MSKLLKYFLSMSQLVSVVLACTPGAMRRYNVTQENLTSVVDASNELQANISSVIPTVQLTGETDSPLKRGRYFEQLETPVLWDIKLGSVHTTSEVSCMGMCLRDSTCYVATKHKSGKLCHILGNPSGHNITKLDTEQWKTFIRAVSIHSLPGCRILVKQQYSG